MYAFAYPGYPLYGASPALLGASAYEYPGFGYGASKEPAESKKVKAKHEEKEEKVKGEKVKPVKTTKAGKMEEKAKTGDKGDKAKAKVSKDKLKSSKKAEKPKVQKAEAEAPRDTLDWPKGVAVSGCKDKTVKKIVRGHFKFAGENHGRPYYKRDEKFNDLDVMLYYWDDRDGSDFSGWWFGPKVGGDQVWAYQPSTETTPPESGWKVPYDGPVDENFKVTRKKEKKVKGTEAAAAYPQMSPGMPGMWYGMYYGMQPSSVDPHAAERQMQEYARLQQEEAKRRLEEDFLRHKREEAMRREAERKRKEEAKKKQEEIRKKKEEEQKLQEQRIKEGKAVFLLRKAIQKLSAATPENMEVVQKEFEETMKLQLEAAGSHKDYMKAEADKCLEQTQKRIELFIEAKRKAQEKKEADEKHRLELENRAKELLAELSGLLDMAEKGVEQLKETAAPLESSDEQTLPEVEACAEAVEAAGAHCKALIKTCMDFLVSHGPEMKEPPRFPGGLGGTSASGFELKQLMARCLTRINECTKLSDGLLAAVRAVTDAAARRVKATKKTAELEELFTKYDADGDQRLSEAEVRAFAKDLGVELSPEAVKQIWKCAVEDGQTGVALSRFTWLKTKLGAEKELRRDRHRKVLREARDKVRANLRAQLDTKVELVLREVSTVDQAVAKAEQSLPPLAEEDRSGMAAELISKSSSCISLVEDARKVAASVQEKVDELPESFAEKDQEDVKDLLVPDLRVLAKKMGRLDLRLQRVENLCQRFTSEVERRQQSELFGARLFAVKVARLYAARRGRSIRQLSREMDANGDGEMDSQEFSLFFLSVDREILDEASAKQQMPDETALKAKAKPVIEAVDFTEDLLARLFKTVAEPGGMLSEDVFCQMMRSYCKVVKDTVMSKELKVSGDNAVRRLNVDEVVEVLEGPVEEAEMKVPRIKARCIADDAEGWLTLRGNDGIAHLQDWHALFWILRDVPLTASFERPADPKFLERLDEMEDRGMPDMQADEAEPEGDKADNLAATATEVEVEVVDAAEAVEAVTGVAGVTGVASPVAEAATEVGDEGDEDDVPFDPESPEGPGAGGEDFVPETVGYQLLQHVDSPEHEDPDEGFRRLRAGELVEVLEWPSNHLESGLTRMKVLALSDKASGWITQTNADGVHFAEPL